MSANSKIQTYNAIKPNRNLEFDAMFAKNNAAVALIDRKGTLLMFNPAFAEFFKVEQDSAVYMNYQHFGFDSIYELTTFLTRIEHSESILTKHLSILKLDHEASTLDCKFLFSKDFNGVLLFGEIEQETIPKLKLSTTIDSQLNRIIEHLPIAAFVTTIDKIIDINDAFCNLLGFTKDQLIDLPISQIMGIEDVKHHKSFANDDALNQDSICEKQIQFKTKEKERINTNTTIIIQPDKANGTVHYIFFVKSEIVETAIEIYDPENLKEEIAMNVALLEEKNQQLNRYQKSNAQLENFAYIASHDLREPLRTIGNFSQLLNKRIGKDIDETSAEYFKFIVDGVQNMNLLINDLLTYSRANTQENTSELINLQDLLFMIVRSLDKTIKEHDTTIQIEDIPETIFANKTKIKQVFQNLIANAIKFKNKEIAPVIHISGVEKENCWEFSVKDNGIGIKDEFFEKIFLLFKKLHSKQEYQGSGIGLALCKKIVEQHGGDIWLESVPEKGTTFYFTLNKIGIQA